LEDKLPEVNRRAFDLLAKRNYFSACLWRDSAIFANALREKLSGLNLVRETTRLESRSKGKKLEVTLVLTGDQTSQIRRRELESECRELLIRCGLFGAGDVFSIHIESQGSERSFGQLSLIEPAQLDDVLRDAKRFLEEKVFFPALRWSADSERTIHVVRDTRYWISRFEKIGDLVRYMDRFRPDTRQTSLSFMDIKQIRFEDVYADFSIRFGRYRGFGTNSADFVQGQRYNAFTLSIYTQSYNNRGAGIRPVGKVGNHEAVVVNITLAGGRYRNEWLEYGKRLKCYLKAPVNRGELSNDEELAANRAIMRYPSIPILVFTRQSGEKDYLYHGIFRYTQIAADEGGKWFDLVKIE
jgi:hypothetical protein